MTKQLLGEPLDGLAVWASAYRAYNGEPRIYSVSSGKPCMLHIVDPNGHDRPTSLPLEGSDHCWGVVAAPTGIYIGGSGILYRYTHEGGVENLGEIAPGEFYTWRLAVDADGNIYGGCYPGGTVFQYDPAAGMFRNYGPIVAGEQYARSMAAWNGKLYVGAGTKRPHLVKLDTATGARSELALPDGCAGDQLVYDVDIVQGKLFARLTPSQRLFVYDLETEAWVDCLENAYGLSVSAADSGGHVYFVQNGHLQQYTVATKELRPTSLAMPEPAGDFGWLRIEQLSAERDSLVGVYRNGEFWAYDPATGRSLESKLELPGQAVFIQSLAQGPGNSVFAGGYFAGGLARIDAETLAIESYRGVGQTEGLIADGREGLLYLGVYPKAIIMVYDPRQPWEPGINPRKLFSLQSDEQDRPFAFAWAHKELAVGTVPSYGRHGGALSLYHPGSGRIEVHRHLLPSQSIVSLVRAGGYLVAGGSVWGGLGIAPEAEHASLLLWDIERRELAWTGVPVTGEKAISALAVDDGGLIWGLTEGLLFQFDLEARRTVKTVRIFDTDWAAKTHFWRGGCELVYRDGALYGTAAQHLFRYDLLHGVLVMEAEEARLLVADSHGAMYYASGTKLYRWKSE